jgi:hypothetical protein
MAHLVGGGPVHGRVHRAPAESEAKRTATPRAMPAVVRKLRILRAPRLRQASDERRRTG